MKGILNSYSVVVGSIIHRYYPFIEHMDITLNDYRNVQSQDIYLNKEWFLINFKDDRRLIRYIKNHKTNEIRNESAYSIKQHPMIKKFMDEINLIWEMIGVEDYGYRLGKINIYVK